MNYLIDGFNLGYKIPAIASLLKKGETEKAIPLILNHVSARLRGSNDIIVVFDGKSGITSFPSAQGRIRVKFSRKPQTADDIIRQFIRNESHPKDWTVISSDNEIIFTARDMGAQVLNADQFVSPIITSSKQKNNSEKYDPQNVDVDSWLKLFDAGEGK